MSDTAFERWLQAQARLKRLQADLERATDLHKTKAITLYRQGDINYLINEEPGSHGRNFAAEHGPCAPSMAFRVVDAKAAYKEALVDRPRSGFPLYGIAMASEQANDASAATAEYKDFLEANNLKADWQGIENAPNEALVNALAMMSPYGAAEKQALLEAPDLKTRAELLVAVTEIELAKKVTGSDTALQ